VVLVLFGRDDPDIGARLKIIFYYTHKNFLLTLHPLFFIIVSDTRHGSTINKDLYALISPTTVVVRQAPVFQNTLIYTYQRVLLL